MTRTANHPDGKIVASERPAKIRDVFRIFFSDTETVDRLDSQVCHPDAHARDSDSY